MKNLLYRYRHAWVFTYFILYLPWYFGLQLRDISFHDVYTSIDAYLLFHGLFILIFTGSFL